MGARIIWLLSALVVVGGCVLPVWKGLELIRYSRIDDKPEAALPWVNVPGLAFFARQFSLTSTDDSSDDTTIRKRRDDLVDILAIRPLSSYYWLQLAESRVDAGEGPSAASGALELSVLTGPNEGYMITHRGLFGIWQWEVLSPEAKSRAIKDLVELQPSDAKLAWLRADLAKKPEQVRQEIHIALQAQGFSKSNLSRIGF